MEFLINGVLVGESDVTPQQWEDMYEKDMAENIEATHADPMEREIPEEFLKDCN